MSNKGKEKVICHFQYATNICVLERSMQEVAITFKCLAEVCKVDLLLSRRKFIDLSEDPIHRKKKISGEILKLNKEEFSTIVEIYSDNSD